MERGKGGEMGEEEEQQQEEGEHLPDKANRLGRGRRRSSNIDGKIT